MIPEKFSENLIMNDFIKSSFFLNYQQHRSDRSGNYFLPCFSYVKIVIVTDKFGRICDSNFKLIICTKRSDMSWYVWENLTWRETQKCQIWQICQIWQNCIITEKHEYFVMSLISVCCVASPCYNNYLGTNKFLTRVNLFCGPSDLFACLIQLTIDSNQNFWSSNITYQKVKSKSLSQQHYNKIHAIRWYWDDPQVW